MTHKLLLAIYLSFCHWSIRRKIRLQHTQNAPLLPFCGSLPDQYRKPAELREDAGAVWDYGVSTVTLLLFVFAT